MPPVRQVSIQSAPSTNGVHHDDDASTEPTIKAFTFHGMDLRSIGSEQSVADCPFCGKEGKFYLHEVKGTWDCKTCGDKGNLYSFLRALHRDSMAATRNADREELARERGLLDPATVAAWGVCKSTITGEWLVPGYGVDGKLNQLSRYVLDPKTKKRRLYGTPTCKQQLFGASPTLYDEKRADLYLCEGVWDAMTLWELLGKVKRVEGVVSLTAAESMSMLHFANVLAVPGCQTFNEKWASVCGGKRVHLLYDSDHPRQVNGKTVEPAGWLGMRKVAATLAVSEHKPESVHWLAWGPDGFDPTLPSGTDLRDLLTSGESTTAKDRVPNLSRVLERIEPIPDAWIAGKDKKAAKGKMEIAALPCSDWKTLVNAWRKAMRWNEGLDRALSVMLASLASTNSIGEQLWVRVLAPPSCLAGETPIHDPIDRTTLSVKERTKIGKPFFVYSKNDRNEVIVARAEPPKRYPISEMFKITMKSGRTMRVTSGHRVWTGEAFVSVAAIGRDLRESACYPLPTISESGLLIRVQGVQSLKKTVQDSQDGCPVDSCSCGERLHSSSSNVRSWTPSPTDAQQRNRFDSCWGGSATLCKRSRPVGQCDRPSNEDFLDLEEPLEAEVLPLLSRDTCERRGDLPSTLSRFHKLKDRYDGLRQSDQFSFSEGGNLEVRIQSLSESLQRADTLSSAISRTLASNSLFDSPQKLRASWNRETERNFDDSSYGACGLLPSIPLSTFGLSENRRSWRTQLPPMTCPTCKDRPLGAFDLPTTPSTCSNSVRETLDTSILSEFDAIEKIEPDGWEHYYDFHVPETENYWACGYFHHNTGKSTLAEALSANTRHVVAKSTIRGFHSGFQTDADAKEDYSLLSKLNGKTLITKDGDTLLQSPNLPQILSEARDVYDRVSRTSYRNKASRDYLGISMTWILLGTAALRSLDTSELGERFLTCAIMDGVDEEEEREIVMKVLHRQSRVKGTSVNDAQSLADPDMTKAMQLTSGYVDHLGKWANPLLQEINDTEDQLGELAHLAVFISYLRARPSIRQIETVERELAARLASQLHRLATCLAVVLNRKTLDEEVMRRVRRVAMDTAKGRTLDIVTILARYGEEGIDAKSLALLTAQTEAEERTFLKFLKRLRAVEAFTPPAQHGIRAHVKWRLSPRLAELYGEVCGAREEVES